MAARVEDICPPKWAGRCTNVQGMARNTKQKWRKYNKNFRNFTRWYEVLINRKWTSGKYNPGKRAEILFSALQKSLKNLPPPQKKQKNKQTNKQKPNKNNLPLPQKNLYWLLLTLYQLLLTLYWLLLTLYWHLLTLYWLLLTLYWHLLTLYWLLLTSTDYLVNSIYWCLLTL